MGIPLKNRPNALVLQTANRYKISRKATNSVLANDLLLREVQKAVPYVRGRLLDVGCGEKPYKDVLSPHVSSYVGIDLPQTIHAQSEIDAFANAHHLPFKKETFDTVLCLEALEHVERPLDVIREIHAVLRKGGTLILSAPQNYCLHNDPADFYRFTKQGLAELVGNQAGFAIRHIHSLGGTREFLFDALCKWLFLKAHAGILGRILPRSLKKFIVTAPQVLYLAVFKNTDVNVLFSLGNIIVAVK